MFRCGFAWHLHSVRYNRTRLRADLTPAVKSAGKSRVPIGRRGVFIRLFASGNGFETIAEGQENQLLAKRPKPVPRFVEAAFSPRGVPLRAADDSGNQVGNCLGLSV